MFTPSTFVVFDFNLHLQEEFVKKNLVISYQYASAGGKGIHVNASNAIDELHLTAARVFGRGLSPKSS